MIDQKLYTEKLKKKNYFHLEEEVDKKFKELKKNIDNDEEYKKNLEKIGINDEFLRYQQEDLAITKLQK